jgi:hypothetical protein
MTHPNTGGSAAFWRTAFLIAVSILLIGAALLLLRPARSAYLRVANPPGILREISLLKELVTVRYRIQKVTGLTEARKPFGSESILLIVQAQVLAGIDLSELREEHIRVKDQRTVSIGLPPPRILHVYLDEKQTQVWDRTKTWWTPWVPYSKDLEQKARLAAIQSIAEEADNMGILGEAQASAEALIRGLLRPLGFENIEFYRPST